MHIRDGTNTTKKNCFILFAFKPFWIIHNAYSWFGLEKKAWAFSIFVFSNWFSLYQDYLFIAHSFGCIPRISSKSEIFSDGNNMLQITWVHKRISAKFTYLAVIAV